MLTRKADYKEHLCRQFNRIMKNKNEKYVFANLKCCLVDKNLYFMIGPDTYIIQAISTFYEHRLKPIDNFLKFKFSHLNLNNAYTNSEIEQSLEEGFTVMGIRKKF